MSEIAVSPLHIRLGLAGLTEIFMVRDDPDSKRPYDHDERARNWYRVLRKLTWYTLCDPARHDHRWPDFAMLGLDIIRHAGVEQGLFSRSVHIVRGADRVVIAELDAFALSSADPTPSSDTRLIGAVSSKRALALLVMVRLAL